MTYSPVRRFLLAGAFVATFAAGGFVLPAAASAMQDAMDGHMGAMGHMGQMGGMPDHAGMHAMMHAHIAHMLDVAGATPEQKSKIHDIFKSAFQQVTPLHQKLAGAHHELHRILTAPTIDRAALEQLRAEHMADFDQASRVMIQALADAAEVLTPEQRAKIAGAMAEEHSAHTPQP